MADRGRDIPERRGELPGVPTNGASGDGADGQGTAAEERARRSRLELVQKYVIWGLGGVVGLAVLAVLILIIVLQTEWGREKGKDFIVVRLNALVDGAEFKADDLTGNFIGGVALLDLELVTTDGEVLVRADTFAARYSLLPLLLTRLKIKNVDLINPRIWMTQQPDGTWDLLNVIARDDSATVDTAETWATRLVIELDHLYVGDGQIDARFYSQNDSVLQVRDLYVDLGNAEFGRKPLFELDSLVARFSPPAQDYWANVFAGATLNDSLLVVDGFRLTSPRSNVSAGGSLALPGADSELITDIDFNLTAAPLAFDDIRPFVPGLRQGETLALDLDVGGAQDLLIVDGDARFSDGGTLQVEGSVSPDEPDVRFDLTAAVRAFDLSILTGNPSHSSSINTDLDVDLAGTVLGRIDGTANATIFQTRYGTLAFDRTTLNSSWESGRARLDAQGGLRGTRFSLAGDVRPFDDSPSYNLSGRVSGFDIGNFTEGDLRSNIGASMRVDGRGFDQNAAFTADVQLSPSTFNDYRIEYGVLDLAMEDGRLNFGTRFRFPDGQAFAQGVANFNESEVSYSVSRGRLENLDLASLLGTGTSSGFNASFSLNGTGTNPDLMSLRAEVDVFDSHYGDVTVAAADLNVSIQDGYLRANTAADLEQAGAASFIAEGRPFAAQPTFQITSGEFRQINLGRLTQNPGLTTDLTGTAVFNIRGFDPQQMALEGRVDLDPSRLNEQTINSAFLVANMERGNLNFTANVNLPEGQTLLTGVAQPFLDVPSYSVTDGRFSNINLAAFTGNESLESALTGTFTGSGRGFDPQSMVFQGRLQIAPSVINQQQINQIRTQIAVQRGRLELDTNIDLPDGDTQFIAAMDFGGEETTYAIERGTFQNLNIGALLGNPNFQTSLTGSLEAEGTGFDPEAMVLDGTLNLSDSRINEQEIDSAAVTGTFSGGTLTFDARMVAPEGISDVAGNVDFRGEMLAYTVTEGQLQGLDVGALSGNPQLSTNITATVAFQGRGTDPETMTVDGTIDFARSVINNGVILDGLVAASVNEGLMTLDGDLQFTNGGADVEAEVRLFEEVPTYRASGQVQNVDVGAFLGADTLRSVLTANFDLSGVGFEPETMSLRGQLHSDTTRYQDARIRELSAAFALDSGYLEIDTLVLRSNFADVNAGGEIALFGSQVQYGSDFTFIADVYDAEPIRAFIPADAFAMDEGHLEGRVYGRPGNLQFDVMTDVSSLVFNDYRLSGLEGRFAGEITPEGELSIGEFDAGFDYFALPFISIQSSNLTVTYRGDDLLFSGTFQFDETQSGHLEGRVDLREEHEALTLERLDLAFADQDWTLLLPATITYGDEYRVSNFLLTSDDGQIAIDGVLDPNGMQNLVLTIESFQFGSVARLVGFEGLSGTLNGALDLTGPAYDPNLQGALAFTLASEDRQVGDLDLDVRYDSLRLNLDGILTHVEGGVLTLNGYLPTDLSIAPADTAIAGEGVRVRSQVSSPESEVDFTIAADSFDINWIDPFLDRDVMRDLAGKLTAEILVSGTFDSPILDGTLNLTNGRIRLPEFNVTYSDLTANATLAENRLQFTDARLNSGNGSLRAEGSVSLANLTLGEFDINAQLDRFLAVRNAQYEITTSGNLHLAGTTTQPEVSGSLQLLETNIYLDALTGSQFEMVELTDRDIRMLEERFGYQVTAADTSTTDLYENLTLDISVNMGRDTWIRQRRQPEMAIQFEGSLDVDKSPGSDPQIFGTIEVLEQRSYIDQFSRRFNITEGTITFNGTPENFYMDIGAEYQVKDRRNPGQAQVIITLGLTGRLDDLEFELGSNPTMEETDILSYIATGQPAGQTLQLADASNLFVSGGTGLAINEVARLIEGIAGEGLGLDVIEIQHDGLRGAVLIAGKYVSPRVYVGVSQPVSFSNTSLVSESLNPGSGSNTEVTLEYEVFNWLLLKLSGGRSTLRGNLLWEYAY